MDRFCTQCGAQLQEGDRFCTHCGQPVNLSGQTRGQAIINHTSELATDIKGMARQGVMDAKAGMAKGMSAVATKMASAASQMQRSGEGTVQNTGTVMSSSGGYSGTDALFAAGMKYLDHADQGVNADLAIQKFQQAYERGNMAALEWMTVAQLTKALKLLRMHAEWELKVKTEQENAGNRQKEKVPEQGTCVQEAGHKEVNGQDAGPVSNAGEISTADDSPLPIIPHQ